MAAKPEEGDAEAPSPPPTYTYTTQETPPPSYDSVFGQIKDAKQRSSGSADFLKNVCLIISRTIGFTICISISLALPSAMIVIGALNLNNCKMETFIPIWLIVSGAVTAFMEICSIIKKCKANCDGTEEESGYFMLGLNGLFGCFNVAWFIAGNVWVYRNYHPENTTNPTLDNYCDHVTYYFAFWIMTTGYILLALGCCCSSCIAVGGKK